MNEWHFFDIGFKTLNLFSFMLGVTWAFFNQGIFGKRIGQWIFLYFAGLALFYGLSYYTAKEANEKYEQRIKQEQVQKTPEPAIEVPDPNRKLNNDTKPTQK